MKSAEAPVTPLQASTLTQYVPDVHITHIEYNPSGDDISTLANLWLLNESGINSGPGSNLLTGHASPVKTGLNFLDSGKSGLLSQNVHISICAYPPGPTQVE
jgi:hypothetical protein